MHRYSVPIPGVRERHVDELYDAVIQAEIVIARPPERLPLVVRHIYRKPGQLAIDTLALLADDRRDRKIYLAVMRQRFWVRRHIGDSIRVDRQLDQMRPGAGAFQTIFFENKT